MTGVKGRSGRPSNEEYRRARELIGEALTPNDWVKIIRAIAAKARKGSVSHAKLLLSYKFGQPPDEPEGSSMPPELAQAMAEVAMQNRAAEEAAGGYVPQLEVDDFAFYEPEALLASKNP